MTELKVVLSEVEIYNILDRLSREIYSDYVGCSGFEIVTVLGGAMVFSSDLIRRLSTGLTNCSENFRSHLVKVQSFSGTRSTQEVRMDLCLPQLFPKNSNVLLVESIVDSGLTLNVVTRYLRSFDPVDVKVCSLLVRRSFVSSGDRSIDYIGYVLDDYDFVVGYGLDYDNKYRGLPYISKLLL